MPKPRQPSARGCFCEKGHVQMVVVGSPTHFQINVPISAMQRLHCSDGRRPVDHLQSGQNHG
jgi:hypothetical protein